MTAQSKTSQAKEQKSGVVARRTPPRRGPNAPVILFPTERSTIGLKKIRAAVKAVIAERKAAESQSSARKKQ